MTLRVGTRASPLARIQANAVIERLRAGGIDAEAVPLSTRGDRSLGGDLSTHVGQFVTGLDARLLNGDVDLTVHSSKDVPVDVDLQRPTPQRGFGEPQQGSKADRSCSSLLCLGRREPPTSSRVELV